MAFWVRDMMVWPYEQQILWPKWWMWREARSDPEWAIARLGFRDIEYRHNRVAGETPHAPQGETP